jgi:phosphoribosylformylglycinamidine cyclo-ligase
LADLQAAGEKVFRIGEIAEGERGCTISGPAGSWGTATAWSATHVHG